MILQNKQANSRPDSHNDDDRNRLLMTMTLPNNARQKVKNEMPQQEEGRTTFMVQRTGPHFPSVATGQCPGRIGGSGEPGNQREPREPGEPGEPTGEITHAPATLRPGQ